MESPQKRRKLNLTGRNSEGEETPQTNTSSLPISTSNTPRTRRSISPPIRRKPRTTRELPEKTEENLHSIEQSSHLVKKELSPEQLSNVSAASPFSSNETPISNIPSPVQLNSVEDLPDSLNVDTISLKDILGNPLIRECWVFNYLIDVDFVMSKFDADIKDLVQVKIVHGSWRNEDGNKIRIDEAAKRYQNVQAITAYLPEAYGTHHSKMIILFRHDGHAEVVILTANMIAGDWRMCQAVWKSPLLPLQTSAHAEPASSSLPSLGSGARFKHDLLAYLKKYDTRLKSLASSLSQYDFSNVRAALVASTPGKQNLRSLDPDTDTLWGWPAIQRVLGTISMASPKPYIVVQISSVASIGEKWASNTLFDALSSSETSKETKKPRPKFSIIFPTPDEIRRSIDGYSCGGSIHMKTQSVAQSKQLAFLRPMLCHWAGDAEPQSPQDSSSMTVSSANIRKAGRRRVAPHIKTYVRFADSSMTSIDWAMMTSANLSTQAWGSAINASGEVRVCSYEIGVVVWPGLWSDGVKGGAQMVPVFGKDTPCSGEDEAGRAEAGEGIKTKIGWRMPYDLPLVPYGKNEQPWCAAMPCEEPDWMGRSWPGF
ncbi:hypothetical protein MMC07_007502 [Pseudocyphellaria aurata]|nr:hypothetical protein [Pseudocyphellaria aurata]